MLINNVNDSKQCLLWWTKSLVSSTDSLSYLHVHGHPKLHDLDLVVLLGYIYHSNQAEF